MVEGNRYVPGIADNVDNSGIARIAGIAGIVNVVALKSPRKAAQHPVGKSINGGYSKL